MRQVACPVLFACVHIVVALCCCCRTYKRLLFLHKSVVLQVSLLFWLVFNLMFLWCQFVFGRRVLVVEWRSLSRHLCVRFRGRVRVLGLLAFADDFDLLTTFRSMCSFLLHYIKFLESAKAKVCFLSHPQRSRCACRRRLFSSSGWRLSSTRSSSGCTTKPRRWSRGSPIT